MAPVLWTVFLLLPVPGWGLLDGFPLRLAETAVLALIWIAHARWRPKWHAGLPLALVLLKLAAGSLAFTDRGLVGSYFANDAFTPPAARHVVDRALEFGPNAGRRLPLSFLASDTSPFSVSWSGYLLVPRDEEVTVFAHGHDVLGRVAIDGQQVVTLPAGANDGRARIPLRAGWRHLWVTLSSPGPDRTFYAGVIDASGTERPFGDVLVYRRQLTERHITVERIVRGFTWMLDVLALGYLAAGFWRSIVRHRLVNRDGLTLGLIGLGVVLLFIALPHGMVADARDRFDALAGLIEHGRISAMPYSLIGPLFSTPLYYLGTLAFGPEWWYARYNTVLVAIGLIALDSLLRSHVDRRLRWTFLLGLVGASMFPNHVRGSGGEVFTAVCAAVGIAALVCDRARLGWALVVIGVVNTPAALVGMLGVAVWRVWATRHVRHLLPILVAVTLVMLESWVRRGGPFVTGYEGNGGVATALPFSGRPGFSYPIFFGLLSILMSFGKGLLFYAPGLLVPLRRTEGAQPDRLLACYRGWMIFLAGMVLVYAKWWAWYGGFAWGPRFFLFASVPASLALASALRQASGARLGWLLGLVGVTMLSAWVAIDGAVFDQSQMAVCAEQGYALEFLCWHTPEFSALWRPFVSAAGTSIGNWAFAAFAVIACVWLSAPLLAAMGAMARAADFGRMRAAIKSIRF